MTSTLNNKPNFSDGQAVTPADLMSISDQMRAFLLDQVIGGAARVNQNDITPLTNKCFVPSASQGYPVAGSAMHVTNAAGLVFQCVAAPDGVTPKMLGYSLAASELSFTIAAADPSYPRVDMLCIKITDNNAYDSQSRDFQDAVTGALSSQTVNVELGTTIATTIVQGTAVDIGVHFPQLGAIPSGYVPWAYVHVPAAFASTFTNQHISDVRVPMRLGVVDVPAKAMINPSVGTIPLDTAGQYINLVPGPGDPIYAMFPFGAECRLIGFQLHGAFTDPVSTSDAEIACGPFSFDMSTAPMTESQLGPYAFLDSYTPFTPATLTKSVAVDMTTRNHAAWGNGYANGMAAAVAGNDPATKLGLQVEYNQTTGSGQVNRLNFVRFIYAY